MPLQFRHRYAAGIHDDLPIDDIQTIKELPRLKSVVGTHCNPAHIRQVGAGGSLFRGFMLLVHSRYTFLSCLPNLLYLTVLMHLGVVRAAPTFTGVPRVGLPSACARLLRQSGHDSLSLSCG